MSPAVRQFTYFYMKQTKHTPSLNNSTPVFPPFSFVVSRCEHGGFIFPKKTKWHNERMELSWLYLIEFDQVPAQCRSNLPAAL